MSAGKTFTQRLVRASERFRAESALLESLDSHGGIKRSELRAHPCRLQLPILQLPDRLDRAAIEVLKEVDLPPELMNRRATVLSRFLWQRPLPQVQTQRRFLVREIESSQIPKNVKEDEFEEVQRAIRMEKRSLSAHVRRQLAEWRPLRYSPSLAPIYLISRLAPNFAVSCRVFFEIRKRCPDFAPQSLFDFGSGLGTVLWAANSVWSEGSLCEQVMVDSSSSMLSLAERLQRDGHLSPHVPSCFPGVFSRQFLSASNYPTYDLVVANASLLDVGWAASREMVLNALWQKTEGFLVLMEPGTAAGFKAILEARDYIIKNFGPEAVENEEEAAHVFAPCPHALTCPKRESICNFYVTYKKFNLTSPRREYVKELFSYVIFSKGPRRDGPTNEVALSRVISYKPKKDKLQVLHDVCNPDGSAERVAFAKNTTDKTLYRMMAKAIAGDLVPAELKGTKACEVLEEETKPCEVLEEEESELKDE